MNLQIIPVYKMRRNSKGFRMNPAVSQRGHFCFMEGKKLHMKQIM